MKKNLLRFLLRLKGTYDVICFDLLMLNNGTLIAFISTVFFVVFCLN